MWEDDSTTHIHRYPMMGQFAVTTHPNSQLLGRRKENILRGVQGFSWQHTPNTDSHSIRHFRVRGTLPSKHESNNFTSSLHQPNESLMQSHRVPSACDFPRSRAGRSPALTACRTLCSTLRVPPPEPWSKRTLLEKLPCALAKGSQVRDFCLQIGF